MKVSQFSNKHGAKATKIATSRNLNQIVCSASPSTARSPAATGQVREFPLPC